MVPRLSNTKPNRAGGDSSQLNGKQRGGTAARRPNTYHRSMMSADCRDRIRDHRSYEGGRYFTVRIISGKAETRGQKKKQQNGRVSIQKGRGRGVVDTFEISNTCSVWPRDCAVSSRPIDIPGETEAARTYRAKIPTRSRDERARKRTCRVRNRKRIKAGERASDRSIVRISQRRTGLARLNVRVRAVEHRGYILRHTAYAREPPPTWTRAAVALKYRTRTNFRENETIKETRRDDQTHEHRKGSERSNYLDMEEVRKLRKIDEIKESATPRRKRRNNYVNKTAIAVASYNVSCEIC